MGELAAALGLGQAAALIPTLADPKDLFSQLQVAGVQRLAA